MQQQPDQTGTIEQFRPELQPGEQLLWTGRPGRPSSRFQTTRPFGGLFLFVAFFAVVAITQARHSGQSLANLLPFALIAGLMLWNFSRPMRAARNTVRNVSYAVTDKRVLLLTSGEERSLHAAQLSDIPAIEKRERADGSGSIVFTGIPAALPSFTTGSGGTILFLTFEDIPNVDDVYRIIEDHRET